MKYFKPLILTALALTLCAGLAGCMSSANDAAAPQTTADYMPQSGAATATGNAAPQTAAAFDWTGNAAQIENRIAQISEIGESRVVVTGNTALVGVKFTSAYSGEMTERIREMVAAEVMAADPAITTVAVTAEAEDVEEIYKLSERVSAGEDLGALKEDINEIVRNATTLR